MPPLLHSARFNAGADTVDHSRNGLVRGRTLAGMDTGALHGRARVAIVGAGPGGLMAAEVLARSGAAVTVFDRMPSAARKFLLAGRGGLNLTHSEPIDAFLERYGSARAVVEPAVRRFPPDALRSWCASLGQPTFVGSSGRVFPEAFRATPLLRAWLARLTDLGVEFRMRHRFLGWDETDGLRFQDHTGTLHVIGADAVILALGGASWPRTGSDGGWVTSLLERGLTVAPLRPANCGFDIAWSPRFAERYAGFPLKNIAVSCVGSRAPGVRGEAMITTAGIEGGAIYAIGAAVRDAIDRDGSAFVAVDLHPDVTVDALTTRLTRRRPGDSFASHLRRAAGLAPVEVALLDERRSRDRVAIGDARAVACLIKDVRLRLDAARPIDRAISTAGGLALDEIDEHFMLRRFPGVFAVGEMLDWEAPTGGYLLQATFSTAVAAAEGVQRRLEARAPQV